MNKYPEVDAIRSRMEQEKVYKAAVSEVMYLRQMVKNEGIVAKEYKHNADDLKSELKTARKKVKMLSIAEHQQKITKSAAAFASVSGIIMTITYEAFKVWGYPFAKSGTDKLVMQFWNHEAVFAACSAILTWLLAEAYKQANHA
jgi:hypothetical protein